MLPIPSVLKKEYEAYLLNLEVANAEQRTHGQWLRFCLDFCRKYRFHEKLRGSLACFLRKLEKKKQTKQAFQAVMFFYRHVLGKEFGKVEGVLRTKRKPCIPAVLSREEIDAILMNLSPPQDMVVKLLYGCGLRLFECLNLRVQCFSFDGRGSFTVKVHFHPWE